MLVCPNSFEYQSRVVFAVTPRFTATKHKAVKSVLLRSMPGGAAIIDMER